MTPFISHLAPFTAGAFGTAGVMLALIALHRFGGRL